MIIETKKTINNLKGLLLTEQKFFGEKRSLSISGAPFMNKKLG
jgi:hypothetical protein